MFICDGCSVIFTHTTEEPCAMCSKRLCSRCYVDHLAACITAAAVDRLWLRAEVERLRAELEYRNLLIRNLRRILKKRQVNAPEASPPKAPPP